MNQRTALWTLFALVTAMPAAVLAQGPDENRQEGTASSTLDDQLFRDLGGLRSDNGTAAPQPPAEQSPTAIAPSGRAAPRSQMDAWTMVGRQMRQVQSRLQQADDGAETLRIQQQIVERLEQLLQQAPRPAGQSAVSGGGAPRQGPSETTTRPATGDQTGPSDPTTTPRSAANETPRQLLQRVWGHLPDKLQQQLQAVGQEQFLPQYAPQIEAYYRSLSAPATSMP